MKLEIKNNIYEIKNLKDWRNAFEDSDVSQLSADMYEFLKKDNRRKIYLSVRDNKTYDMITISLIK